MRARVIAAMVAAAVCGPLAAAASIPRSSDALLVTSSAPFRVEVVNAETGRVRRVANGFGPVWSPDGKRVAFLSSGTPATGADLFVIDPAGRHPRQLTHDRLVQHDAAWSPDGTRIAYLQQQQPTSPPGGLPLRDDLMVISVATGAVEQVSQDADNKTTLTWSPDGQALAYEVHRRPGTRAVVVNAETGEPVDLWLQGLYPYWSADGRSVAYVTNDHERQSITVARSDGSSAHSVFTGARDLGVNGISWSPNGRLIAFSYGGWSVSWSRIETADVHTSRLHSLTAALRYIDFAPSWSPNGKQIAFVRWQRGQKGRNPSVAIVSRSGGTVRLLRRATVNFDNERPLWRPGPRPNSKGPDVSAR